MSGTIEKARAVLAQLEQTVDVPRDETAAALRELIALAEGLFEDLDDYNTRIARAAKAIGATLSRRTYFCVTRILIELYPG